LWFEIISKYEARNNIKIQISNVQNVWNFEFLSFEFVSDFDIRNSDLSVMSYAA